ncbi:penicillin-binding transpeptidase domain-containing protein [Thalassobacillus hwangdonensis]|uniref:serine-type D-Ala-D-Ala carboxypeptidase n=1 Tax=Thalassobacillus hwangdonensis TaxID=546108 RepID=A0ABW3KXA1_9BACI
MRRILSMMVLILSFFLLVACQEEEKEVTPEERFSEYTSLWEEQKFEDMYEMISNNARETYGKEEAVTYFQKVYDDFKITDVKVSFDDTPPEEEREEDVKEVRIPFQVEMNSMAGKITFDYEAAMVKQPIDEESEEMTWNVTWDRGYIFPQIANGEKLGLNKVDPVRGEIFDKNGNGLAINEDFYSVGVVPERFTDEEKEKEEIASVLGLSVEQIDKALNAGWVQPHLLVPLRNVHPSEEELLNDAKEIAPIDWKKEPNIRYYPLGKAAAHLIGYVAPITAEDLDNMDEETAVNYHANSKIGARGVEQLYEEKLHGAPGYTIYAERETESEEEKTSKVTIAEKPVTNGEDVTLTIDTTIQNELYASLKGDTGHAAAINPQTGETKALVSTPAFDPNKAAQNVEMPTNENNLNRFAATYAPGSTLKPISAAILLSNGAIKPEETMTIEGSTWKKDESWGGNSVTRVHGLDGEVDVKTALIRSDNIFFARAALRMEGSELVNAYKRFGFTETPSKGYPVEASQVSSNNELTSEVLQADTSYGQGELEMSSLHLAASYTPLFNEGNILEPVLLSGESTPAIWKENAMNTEYSDLIRQALDGVVNDSAGTAGDAAEADIRLSGKTGTAELKTSKDDEDGKENGWFVGYPTESPELLIAMMVEDVKDRGQSSFVVEKVAEVFNQLY